MKHIHLLALSALVAGSPAAAHNAWIKPSATTVSGADGWVGFDAAASTNVFDADHNPMALDMVKVHAPDGSEAKIANEARGRYRSTFDVHLDKTGTWTVGTEMAGISGSYMLNGKEYRVGGRRRGPPPGAGGPGGPGGPRPEGGPGGPGRPGAASGGPEVEFVEGGEDFTPPAGATDVKLTQSGMRNEVFVTLGAPSEVKLSGKGLEMQPITHPADLVADEPGQFRFLVDGKPAANLEVEVVPDGRRYRDSQGTIMARTNAQGVATVNWTGAGLYWIHTAFDDQSSPRPGITGRRFQYNATLEVMAP